MIRRILLAESQNERAPVQVRRQLISRLLFSLLLVQPFHMWKCVRLTTSGLLCLRPLLFQLLFDVAQFHAVLESPEIQAAISICLKT